MRYRCLRNVLSRMQRVAGYSQVRGPRKISTPRPPASLAASEPGDWEPRRGSSSRASISPDVNAYPMAVHAAVPVTGPVTAHVEWVSDPTMAAMRSAPAPLSDPGRFESVA